MTPDRPRSRIFSGAELLAGAAIVIGHNVCRVVPNEVPILALVGLLSIRLRDGGLAAIGLVQPPSWRRILLIALAAAALRIILAELVIDPLTSRIWPEAIAPEGADEIRGNPGLAALALLLVWTFAAFGEEVVYRGYLLTRAADVGGHTSAARWIAMVVAAVLFGIGHYYKGPSGMVDSGIAGLILGTAYLLAGRNLWASILAHGFIDTFGLTLLFFGLDS